jgi:hypothetical protein
MRLSLCLVIAAALLVVCSGFVPSNVMGPEQPEVDALLQHLDDLYRSTSSIARLEIDVTTTRSTRNMHLRAWARGEEEVLVLIEAPPQCCGNCVCTS